MNLRKEIQVALNNCEPNTNRVDKIEAIAKKFAEHYHSLQLPQTDVSGSYNDYPSKKVCFFKIENGKYLTDNGMEITNDMLIKHSHYIGIPWNYIVLE